MAHTVSLLLAAGAINYLETWIDRFLILSPFLALMNSCEISDR
jgi:hypothetical protein